VVQTAIRTLAGPLRRKWRRSSDTGAPIMTHRRFRAGETLIRKGESIQRRASGPRSGSFESIWHSPARASLTIWTRKALSTYRCTEGQLDIKWRRSPLCCSRVIT
jgi:hypothetical protein